MVFWYAVSSFRWFVLVAVVIVVDAVAVDDFAVAADDEDVVADDVAVANEFVMAVDDGGDVFAVAADVADAVDGDDVYPILDDGHYYLVSFFADPMFCVKEKESNGKKKSKIKIYIGMGKNMLKIINAKFKIKITENFKKKFLTQKQIQFNSCVWLSNNINISSVRRTQWQLTLIPYNA